MTEVFMYGPPSPAAVLIKQGPIQVCVESWRAYNIVYDISRQKHADDGVFARGSINYGSVCVEDITCRLLLQACQCFPDFNLSTSIKIEA